MVAARNARLQFVTLIREARARVLPKGGSMTYAIAYLAALLAMAGLDFLWLTNMSAALYRRDLGPLLADDPKLGVAAVFYLAYAVGVVIFAVRPALASSDWRSAALYGALFGFFAYATYDLTNFSTLKGGACGSRCWISAGAWCSRPSPPALARWRR
jgi:uncharacterized membrane protein